MKKTSSPAEDFAATVAAKLREQNGSVAWLSEQIGVPDSTLGDQLRKPSTLLFRHACAIRDALGVEL